MDKPAIIEASYCNLRVVPTRKVLQLVFEVPLELADNAYKVLGFPDEHEGKYVAIAPLNIGAR